MKRKLIVGTIAFLACALVVTYSSAAFVPFFTNVSAPVGPEGTNQQGNGLILQPGVGTGTGLKSNVRVGYQTEVASGTARQTINDTAPITANYWTMGTVDNVQTASVIGTTETDLDSGSGSVGNKSITGGTMIVGNIYRWHYAGVLTTSVTPPTIRLRMEFGGLTTLVGDTGAFTPDVLLTDMPWEFDAQLVVRTLGASGTCILTGRFTQGTSTSALATPKFIFMHPAEATIDTTGTNSCRMTITYGAGTAGNTFTTRIINCERIR